ncbi:glycosyltransferase family 4 protein [Paenibacillus segetis]|uniref:Glycosyltransferase subfamily 4-like N-terminal domain-containing protein n=1 Tax=Paenibacillus segetis TaxID=1325360 RepID=A0ABQ1YPZ1_9BACL|nr:glycosyltransferase family 4 protein [Paenibacillus segetis]GGH32203.1 hypothetical protein GCM10008013_36470 [Paenibacillus segetis]
MKIAYLIHWNDGPDSGVFKKVISQITEWNLLGHEVTLFLFTNRWEAEWKDDLPELRLVTQTYGAGLTRFSAFRKLISQVKEWQPDIVYHRFDLYYFALPTLLRSTPSILEINSNDLTEMRFGGKARYLYHQLTRAMVLRAATGFVFVSGEIAEEEHYSRYVRDKVVIGNGFAMAGVSPAEPTVEDRIRLFFIGTPGQPWHGVDSIVALAEMNQDWHFDIVGIQSSDIGGQLPNNMTFHGRMVRREYEPLMLKADVAIGSLALYRNQMKEASPLKVREYLAYGLPIIIGYSDTDFPEQVPFILEIPNTPDNTRNNQEEIRTFVTAWHKKRVERSQVAHLDTVVKEAVRVDYMKHIVQNGGRK